jgi:hypothetical protein
MSSAAFTQKETMFLTALELKGPDRRREFLDQACADNPRLRAEVEKLLAVQADAEQFFTESNLALRIVKE